MTIFKWFSWFIIAWLGILPIFTKAQTSIDEFLKKVEQKHPALQSQRQYREARKLAHQTDLLPDGPSGEFNYLFGSPQEIGDQKEIGISQQIAFPSVYVFQRRQADQLLRHADARYRSIRQEKLLQAKLLALKVIWLNQKRDLLADRYREAERLSGSLQTSLAEGEANAIEAQKAKLNRLNAQEALQSVKGEIQNAQQQMVQMLNGDTVTIADTTFPAQSQLPPLDTILQNLRKQSPRLAMADRQAQAGEQAVKVEKAKALPRLEGGYRYEAIGNQTLQGPHIGLSVPLWGHKNKIDHKRAQKAYYDLRQQQMERNLAQNLKGLYNKFKAKQQSLADYEALFRDDQTLDRLSKALESGEMSVIDYIRERVAIFEAQQRYLRLQYEQQRLYSKIMKYRL